MIDDRRHSLGHGPYPVLTIAEARDLALAHAVGNKVEQSYARTDLLEKRVELMRLWDDFLGGM